jgi:glucose-6-phosphate isomerase
MQIDKTLAWKELKLHFERVMQSSNIGALFQGKENKDRFNSLSFEFDQIFVDFSKQKVNLETLSLLNALAKTAGLEKSIQSFSIGEDVNSTEKRAALHSALRLPPSSSFKLGNTDINKMVQQQLDQMALMIDKLTQGGWYGYSGKPITDIVNLGVGGSNLGPLMVCHALDEFKAIYKNPINIHFASTMDGFQLDTLYEKLNPETTLFVIVSKSFLTIDTLSNAASARSWLLNYCNDEEMINKQHFIGISTKEHKMSEWGVHPSHQLKLWEWVGGRFSLWSSVGLCIALKIGMANFRKLLEGANALDTHFFSTSLDKNIPVLLGLISIWNTNFLNINANAILPYDERLRFLPEYLAQLEMESNGKSVTHSGKAVAFCTSPLLFGAVGSNAQHAFYQLLHQGTQKVACDFIVPIKRLSKAENVSNKVTTQQESKEEQHLLTLANCFAQSRALMLGGATKCFEGSDLEGLSSHMHCSGNQPSTTILAAKLSPYSLGQLLAMYEHKVFVMASIWNTNCFDQWGVELGKEMASDILRNLYEETEFNNFDESTNGLMRKIKVN